MERGGKEGLHLIIASEGLVDVKGLILGSTEEAHCLF